MISMRERQCGQRWSCSCESVMAWVIPQSDGSIAWIPEWMTLPVDVRDRQVDDLRRAQAGTIGHSERGLVLDARGCLYELRYLLLAEHDPQPLWQGHEGQVAAHLGMVERHPEEKPQRRDRAVDGRR